MAKTVKKKATKRKAKRKKKAATKRKPGRPAKPPPDPPPDGWIGLADFCQLADGSPNAINYAIRRGRITTWKKCGQSKFFDPEQSLKEWKEHVNHAKRTNSKKAQDSKTHAEYLEQKKAEIAEFSKIDYDKVPMHEAERREKVYKAKLAEIKFLEQSQKLVEVEVVRMTWTEVARKVRDALCQIPSRMAPELAAETTPGKLERKLAAEINKALEKLSDAHG